MKGRRRDGEAELVKVHEGGSPDELQPLQPHLRVVLLALVVSAVVALNAAFCELVELGLGGG